MSCSKPGFFICTVSEKQMRKRTANKTVWTKNEWIPLCLCCCFFILIHVKAVHSFSFFFFMILFQFTVHVWGTDQIWVFKMRFQGTQLILQCWTWPLLCFSADSEAYTSRSHCFWSIFDTKTQHILLRQESIWEQKNKSCREGRDFDKTGNGVKWLFCFEDLGLGSVFKGGVPVLGQSKTACTSSCYGIIYI